MLNRKASVLFHSLQHLLVKRFTFIHSVIADMSQKALLYFAAVTGWTCYHLLK